MSRLTRDGTAEPVSQDQILRHARGQGNIHFPCSADHEQDWQPYPVDPYSAIYDDHIHIHIYIHHLSTPSLPTSLPPPHPLSTPRTFVCDSPPLSIVREARTIPCTHPTDSCCGGKILARRGGLLRVHRVARYRCPPTAYSPDRLEHDIRTLQGALSGKRAVFKGLPTGLL